MTTALAKTKDRSKQDAANRRNARKSTGPRTEDGKAIAARNATRHGLLSRLEVLPGLERAEDWQGHYNAVLDDLRPEGYLEEVLAERIAFGVWRLGRAARYEREVAAVPLENSEKAVGRKDYEETGPLPNARLEVREARECQDFIKGLDELPEDEAIDAALAANVLERAAGAANVDVYDSDLSFPDYPDGKNPEDMDWAAGLLRNCLAVIAEAGGTTRAELREALIAAYAYRLRLAEPKVEELERELDQYRRQRVLPDGPELEKVNRYETSIERSFYKALHELQRLQAARQGPTPAPVAVDVTLDGSSFGE